MRVSLCTRRISTSSASGSSADDVGSCEDRDPNGLDFAVSGFTSRFHHSPCAAASVASSCSPSPSFAFRCIASSDSVESRSASECSGGATAATGHDDARSVVELSSTACDHSSLLWPSLGRLLSVFVLVYLYLPFLTLLFSWTLFMLVSLLFCKFSLRIYSEGSDGLIYE